MTTWQKQQTETSLSSPEKVQKDLAQGRVSTFRRVGTPFGVRTLELGTLGCYAKPFNLKTPFNV